MDKYLLFFFFFELVTAVVSRLSVILDIGYIGPARPFRLLCVLFDLLLGAPTTTTTTTTTTLLHCYCGAARYAMLLTAFLVSTLIACQLPSAIQSIQHFASREIDFRPPASTSTSAKKTRQSQQAKKKCDVHSLPSVYASIHGCRPFQSVPYMIIKGGSRWGRTSSTTLDGSHHYAATA